MRAVRHHQRLLHLHRRHGAGRHARGARRRRTQPHPRPEVHADTLRNRGLTRLRIKFEDFDLLLSVKLSTVICSVGGKPKLILNFSPRSDTIYSVYKIKRYSHVHSWQIKAFSHNNVDKNVQNFQNVIRLSMIRCCCSLLHAPAPD